MHVDLRVGAEGSLRANRDFEAAFTFFGHLPLYGDAAGCGVCERFVDLIAVLATDADHEMDAIAVLVGKVRRNLIAFLDRYFTIAF